MKHILWGVLLGACSCGWAGTFSAGAALDDAIGQAIRDNRVPGAVLVVGHAGEIIYRKAYGQRAVLPSPEPMTDDTIFDCASLTKVVATTSALMKLFEEGKLRYHGPDDPTQRIIACQTFIRNLGVLSDYLAAKEP